MTATATRSNLDLEAVANRKILQQDYHRLPREPPATVPSVRCDSTVRGWHDPPATAFAAIFVVTACTRCARDRLTIQHPAAFAATTAIAASRPICPLAVRDSSCAAAAATATAARTVEIQSFEAEATPTTTATTCRAANQQQTMTGSPGPFEGP